MATATEQRHPHAASRPATASGRPSATRTFPVRKVSVDYDKYAEAHSTGEQTWLVDNDPIPLPVKKAVLTSSATAGAIVQYARDLGIDLIVVAAGREACDLVDKFVDPRPAN